MKEKLETYLLKEGQIVTECKSEIEDNMQQNMGIGFLHPGYIEISKDQDIIDEFLKINDFLKTFVVKYANDKNLNCKDIKIDFINYGKTELVYVLTEQNNTKFTLLVKQPAVPFGKVKQEAIYLSELKNIDNSIIAPIDYFHYEDQELYMTPYISQARCIASYNSWGMYVPEPYYRFEIFSDEQEKIVNTCMIAKLVSLYNNQTNEGIISCKLGGGDFMLAKGWENEKPTIENTLANLYLIAAREKISCSFDSYLNLIKSEFSRRTIDENEKNIIINLRGRVPMKKDDIEYGIELGKQLIESKKQKIYKI